mmetsp:Transcript_15524/g.50888  ORF Transcript_15524/g.50888 Transcript_15524/m.50888 type:complete len:380 (-) Transcript_15524:964-2103(-)
MVGVGLGRGGHPRGEADDDVGLLEGLGELVPGQVVVPFVWGRAVEQLASVGTRRGVRGSAMGAPRRRGGPDLVVGLPGVVRRHDDVTGPRHDVAMIRGRRQDVRRGPDGVVQERVAEGVVGLDARRRRVVEHAVDEVQEEVVVRLAVARLASTAAPGTSVAPADDRRHAPRWPGVFQEEGPLGRRWPRLVVAVVGRRRRRRRRPRLAGLLAAGVSLLARLRRRLLLGICNGGRSGGVGGVLRIIIIIRRRRRRLRRRRRGSAVAGPSSEAPALAVVVEELVAAVRVGGLDHRVREHAEDVDELAHLIELVGAREEGFPRVHLHEDAPQGPDVDGDGVGQAEHHLGAPVEARLDVGVHASVGAAARAEVDDLDRRPLGVP